jgi:hypothetical protein
MKGNNENNEYNGSNEYQKATNFLEKGCTVHSLYNDHLVPTKDGRYREWSL